MGFFSYQGTDSQGRPTKGTIMAGSAAEAGNLLAGAGVRIQSVQEMSAAQARPAPAVRQAPVSTPVAQSRPVSIAAPKVVASGPAPYVRTRMGTDKERFFLFSQMAAAYRAGISPYQALTEIAARSAEKYRPPLQQAALNVRDGGSLADALAPYEDLFPDHAVATVRAGETGGFVPDALDEVSRQAEEAHKFKRWFFWVWFVAINALLSIPGMWMTTRGLLRGWEIIDAKGGDAKPMFTEMFQGMAQGFVSKWGAMTLVLFVELALLYWYLRSRRTRAFRHRLGLRFPTFGRRAKHEGFARFAWTMSRVSRGGVAPARAWQLAVETVPNMALREPLMEVSRRLHGSEKLSDIVGGTGLFPQEYVPVIATAEYTGDIPGALDNLSRASGGEYYAAQNYAKARSGCWGALGCFVTSAAMLGMFWYAWYYELPRKVLDGLEWIVR